MGFRLVYLHLILTHFKGQDQGHAYMTVSVLEILRDSVQITTAVKQQVRNEILIGIFTFDLDILDGKIKVIRV